MVRSLITPETNTVHIAIPDDYIGKKVEILVFTYDETTEPPATQPGVMSQFWGVISEQTTREMHDHVGKSRFW